MKLEKTIIIILILLSFFVIISTTLDPDLGWHIKSGEWIINHQQIQHHDEFSYTMAGHQWVNHEWLVDTILYLSYHHQLWIVMTILFTIISSLPFIYYTLQSKNYPELSYILLSSIILIPYLAVRPQIISFFLFFVLYLLLQKIFQSKSSPIFTLATILLFLSWANIHAGFPAGLILFAIFIISKISQSYQTHKKIIWPAKQLAIFASSILVTFINPYTYHLYSEIYHVAASEITAKYIAEWQPILSTVRPENLIYLGLTISFTIIFFKKIKLYYTLPAIIFGILWLKSSRMGPLFIISSIPFVLLSIDKTLSLIKKAHQSKQASNPKKNLHAKIIGIIAILLLFYSLYNHSQPNKSQKFPDSAIAYLKNNPTLTSSNIYNPYTWGGYLILNLPDTKVFIDGRMPHWQDQDGNGVMKDYIKIQKQAPDWYQIFQKHNIQVVLVENTPTNTPNQNHILYKIIPNFLLQYIQPNSFSLQASLQQKNWQIVYQDNTASILTPSK